MSSELDIMIWDMEGGLPTTIKINNMVLPVSKNKPDDLDPLIVAQIFLETFDLSKPVKYINKESCVEREIERRVREDLETYVDNTLDIHNKTDVIAILNGTHIKKAYLDLMYEKFGENEFTASDVYEKCKIPGCGVVRIYNHLQYLVNEGILEHHKTRSYQSVYRFIQSPDKINTKPKEITPKIEYLDDNLILWNNKKIDTAILRKLYRLFKDEVFTIQEARARLNSLKYGYERKISYERMLDHANYLLSIGVAVDQNIGRSGKSGRKIIKFKVPPEEWGLPKDKNVECCAHSKSSVFGPDVIVKQSGTMIPDFDPEEVKNRRNLELETLRKGK